MRRKPTTALDDLEPWVPRPRQVILAELRGLAEQYLAADLDWYKERFPNVWADAPPARQLDARGQGSLW